ncbi:MAG: TolC family protein [Gammaproteobacteria bacterium]|nr:TolC family protein [Gammaproteobacteria bacterium]
MTQRTDTAPPSPPRTRPLARLAAGALALALAGCAIYRPSPLPRGPELAPSLPAKAPRPLDLDQIATLAVLNNPDLNTVRARLGVAQAQAFAAGILPNPQFNFSSDRPIDRVNAPADPRYPEYHAYGFGLSIDLRALLTQHSRHAAAHAALRQAREELLWREWQTVAEARLLYVAQTLADRRRALLDPSAAAFARAAARSRRALAEGNVARDQADADQAILVAVRAQATAAAREANQSERALRALLGLAPQVEVPLAPLPAPPIPSRAAIEAATRALPQRRPDLRALRAGYRSQEEQVRIAVLSQFPNVVIGVNRARDFSDVHSLGDAVSFDLPLFDRGQGEIAIQRATRAQLRAEYLARLDQSTADVWQLWSDLRRLHAQLEDLDRRVPRLARTVSAARRAYRAGNYPAASYLGLVGAYLGAAGTRIDVLQSLWSDSIALATLTGTQVEPAIVAGHEANPT